MAKILKILTNPNPILRKKSVEISQEEINSRKIKALCSDMVRTMCENDGVGLSAPQIGQNIRLCIVNTENGPTCLINPKITKKSWAKVWGEEGCLSVPDIFGQVRRHKKITYKYFDENSKKKKLDAVGLLARVIQHEIDHLDGVLFIDKAKNIKEIKKE
jgi:peptide deformylase